eukprot:TRINITY_DN180_c0_g2_i1.p1 TRINITY_DN180_c0_g2~~TRINITY_DN180_c0_g2_i1.p1  ORF type:complete len:661 (+),score=110.15 TRINITY_DN180_c0_g2_i1:280-2262(+)
MQAPHDWEGGKDDSATDPPECATSISLYNLHDTIALEQWEQREAPRCFQAVVSIAIFLNAIALGVSAEYPEPAELWMVVSNVMTLVWVVEALYKLRMMGWAYFRAGWNRVDFVLALCAIADTWVVPTVALINPEAVQQSSFQLSDFQAMRMLRLLKILRVVRLLETRKELIAMVEGLLGAVRALVWILLFLVIVIYAGAIFCMTVVEKGDIPTSELFVDGDGYFSDLGASMLTLFNMCILAEWVEIVRPLAKSEPFLLLFFVAYIAVTTFGILNLIIGVIAERTMAASQVLKDQEENKEKQAKIQLLNEMAEGIFKDDDALSLEEMQDLVASRDNSRLLNILMEVGLPRGIDVPELHLMFDLEYEGMLSRKEFSDGLYGMIFNDEFQRDCMSQLAFGQLKKMVTENSAEIMTEVKQLRADMSTVLTLLRPCSDPASISEATPLVAAEPIVATVPASLGRGNMSAEKPMNAGEDTDTPSALKGLDEQSPSAPVTNGVHDPASKQGGYDEDGVGLPGVRSYGNASGTAPGALEVTASAHRWRFEDLLPAARTDYAMLPPIQWAMLDKMQSLVAQLREDLQLPACSGRQASRPVASKSESCRSSDPPLLHPAMNNPKPVEPQGYSSGSPPDTNPATAAPAPDLFRSGQPTAASLSFLPREPTD